jgi:ketosteroid isomerase-like protein
MEDNLSLIISYYQEVDAKNIDTVLAMFHEDAHYVRAEKTIHGKPALKEFYTKERKLSGHHKLNKNYKLQDMVVIEGVFEGINGKSENVAIGFADFFEIKNHQIIRRNTYLSRGSAIVQ